MNYWLNLNGDEIDDLFSNKLKYSFKLKYTILKLSNLERYNYKNNYTLETEIFGYIPKINKIRCKYCGNCLNYCKNKAINFSREIPNVGFDMQKCNFCGICTHKCSISAIMLHEKIIGYLKTESLHKNLTIIEAVKKYPKYPNSNFIESLKENIQKNGRYLILQSNFKLNEINNLIKGIDADFIIVSDFNRNTLNKNDKEKFVEVDINFLNMDFNSNF